MFKVNNVRSSGRYRISANKFDSLINFRKQVGRKSTLSSLWWTLPCRWWRASTRSTETPSKDSSCESVRTRWQHPVRDVTTRVLLQDSTTGPWSRAWWGRRSPSTTSGATPSTSPPGWTRAASWGASRWPRGRPRFSSTQATRASAGGWRTSRGRATWRRTSSRHPSTTSDEVVTWTCHESAYF